MLREMGEFDIEGGGLSAFLRTDVLKFDFKKLIRTIVPILMSSYIYNNKRKSEGEIRPDLPGL